MLVVLMKAYQQLSQCCVNSGKLFEVQWWLTLPIILPKSTSIKKRFESIIHSACVTQVDSQTNDLNYWPGNVQTNHFDIFTDVNHAYLNRVMEFSTTESIIGLRNLLNPLRTGWSFGGSLISKPYVSAWDLWEALAAAKLTLTSDNEETVISKIGLLWKS